ncbi:hypothetical protein Cgig2_017580 [Carnegiea gigantea]|uniref:Rx N-terminal domain-containing protein n=1 Tax=Carnegiea gigantea TaxID=171969 RepID=A0A9Q1KMF2_9CARY|nr:hypothetical protein Cgig2_017580 [Carnegiea gigantea]
MAESIVSDLIGRALELLGQSAVDRIAPYFGGRGKLNELQLTMEMIQARLHDAEMRQEAEDGALIKSWLKRLKRAMYRLEDLLEEVTVIDKQDEHRASGKLTKMVCFLPSNLRFLKMNKRLFYEAQDIMRELDRVTSNMDRFHFNVSLSDQERGALKMQKRREETYSFIQEEEVIGRDEDKKRSSSYSASHIRSFFTSQRSPFLRYSTFSIYFESNLNDIFSSLRQLRALDLGQKLYDSLPDSIGELKHLRYLRVRMMSYDLPRGITKLQYLQTLNLNGSLCLMELPSEFYKLTNLQHLQITPDSGNFYSDSSLIDLPPRFGELISLQSLDKFIVRKNRLDALSRMNLVGKLGIFYVKHQQNATLEAKKANLKAKKLTVLHLSFNDEELVTDEANELLECLQPPSTLKHLSVNNWKGTRFPNWGIHQLPNLVTMRIVNCRGCQHLPPFSQLPHLKNLDISDCEELDLWDVNEQDGDIDNSGDDNFVNSSTWACLKSLYSLSLSKMSNLQSLPSGIGGISTLEELSISGLFNLKTLPESIGQLSRLHRLQLRYCPQLEALPRSIQNLAALQQLRVVGCPQPRSRCLEPGRDDWPLIQHIPCIEIRQLRALDLGDDKRYESLADSIGKLKQLRINLVRSLGIFYKKHRQDAITEAKKANLKGKERTVLYMRFLQRWGIS